MDTIEFQKVTINDVRAATNKGINYDKLITEFGSSKITENLIERIEKITNRPAHYFLKRGIFFSHRNLESALESYEKKIPFFIYTGRGPSSESMHIGHLVPFLFCKYLQDAFDVPLVIQMTDDEKFLQKDLTIEEAYAYGKSNLRDIIAIGFDPAKTFIFSDIDYISGCKEFYKNILKIQKCYNYNQVRSIFGFEEQDNIGKMAFAAVQAAPSFSSSFPHLFGSNVARPCVIPCAIDQDPYFRLTRDIAPRIGYLKPTLIHSTFIPALQGAKTKMSSSDTNSSILLSDSPSDINHKVNKYAFTGGQATMEEQRRLGADISVDVPIAYLSYFYDNEEDFQRIKTEYASGAMLTGEVKSILVKCLQKIVADHQVAKAALTEEYIQKFLKFQ